MLSDSAPFPARGGAGKTITLIDDETTARQFALCFFANPFVDEAVTDEEMQVKRIGEDYHVDVPPTTGTAR
ncbi:MAG: hypothetical protein ACLUO8_12460 [Christensenellales bacterium]